MKRKIVVLSDEDVENALRVEKPDLVEIRARKFVKECICIALCVISLFSAFFLMDHMRCVNGGAWEIEGCFYEREQRWPAFKYAMDFNNDDVVTPEECVMARLKGRGLELKDISEKEKTWMKKNCQHDYQMCSEKGFITQQSVLDRCKCLESCTDIGWFARTYNIEAMLKVKKNSDSS